MIQKITGGIMLGLSLIAGIYSLAIAKITPKRSNNFAFVALILVILSGAFLLIYKIQQGKLKDGCTLTNSIFLLLTMAQLLFYYWQKDKYDMVAPRAFSYIFLFIASLGLLTDCMGR